MEPTHITSKSTINEHINNTSLRYFIFTTIPKAIYGVQSIRNESVHGEFATINQCITIRDSIIGIGSNGILCDLITM